jgi:hypothetical protein
VNAAKTWEWSSDGIGAESIDCELKKEHHRISHLSARVSDKGASILAALPDPAFENVPVKLYVAKPGAGNDVSYLFFDGKITELRWGFPGPETLQITAHDNSVDARRAKKYRTFKNKTSVQIAQSILSEYGYSFDVSLGSVALVASVIDSGAELSDWDHVGRALAADGLEIVGPRNDKITIRQAASSNYSPAFTRGDQRVQRVEVQISHVHGPGASGDKHTLAAEDSTGSTRSTLGNKAIETNKENASERTHRLPPAKVAAGGSQAHSENRGSPWTNVVTRYAHRKDTLTLTTTPLADISLTNTITMQGYGAKIDGTWHPVSIRLPITGEKAHEMILTCERGPSPGARKNEGLAAEGS